MAYSFTLSFEGVCAFVPDKPIFIYEGGQWEPAPADRQPTKMSVLLPDLRLPDRARFDPAVFRVPHFPVLKFDLDDLVPENSSRFVDLVVREFHSRLEFGLCLLRKEVLSIDTASRLRQFKCVSTKHEKQPKNPKEEKSLWWLPRMAELETDPNGGQARAELDPTFSIFPTSLVAAIQVDDGLFHCIGFNRSAGEFLEWRFAEFGDNGPGKWNKAIGNRMAVRFDDLDEAQPVRIHLERRSMPTQPTILEFRPRLGKKNVEVEISNLEPEELFEDSGLSHRPWPDADFEEFYKKISASANAPNVIPDFGRKLQASGSERKPCAPALFSGFK